MRSAAVRSIGASEQRDVPQAAQSSDASRPFEARSFRANSKVRQLRRAPRVPVDLAVHIASESGDLPARLIDISRTGAGVSVSHAFLPGDTLRLELDSGRVLAASVRWSAPGRLGVRFDAALLPGDPMLSGVDAPEGAWQTSPDQAAGLAAQLTAPPSLAAVVSRIAVRQARVFRAAYRDLRTWRQMRAAHRAERRDYIMRERACREQGSAWLVDI